MQYFKIGTGKFIQYDETNDNISIIFEKKIVEEKKQLEEKLDIIKEPTKDELAEYGKMYHPYYGMDSISIQKQIDNIDTTLAIISKVK